MTIDEQIEALKIKCIEEEDWATASILTALQGVRLEGKDVEKEFAQWCAEFSKSRLYSMDYAKWIERG